MANVKSIDSNWVNHHYELLRKYQGQWVAYDEDGIITVQPTLDLADTIAKKIGKDFNLYYVNPLRYKGLRFLPIHFNAVKIHPWQPVKSVILKALDKEIHIDMLIDSGADCSLISNETGLKLNLTLSPLEATMIAEGIGGGRVEYVMRRINILIDGHEITAPVAWVQSNNSNDEIIGREKVFDEFDIEFKQRSEQIIFKRVKSDL